MSEIRKPWTMSPNSSDLERNVPRLVFNVVREVAERKAYSMKNQLKIAGGTCREYGCLKSQP